MRPRAGRPDAVALVSTAAEVQRLADSVEHGSDARGEDDADEAAFAFLGDVYLLGKRSNARMRFNRFSQAIFDFTRVRTNLGKIRC